MNEGGVNTILTGYIFVLHRTVLTRGSKASGNVVSQFRYVPMYMLQPFSLFSKDCRTWLDLGIG
jgi:hypothetical protein